ncbi:protein FRIGIDA-ESSENTIAL 1-like [Asparagus officinalis]|nr:protein FRIGIDA-ESSENTIAL 1-like [Asparagus officinalis]
MGVSSTSRGSDCNSSFSNKEDTGGCFVAHDSSAEILSTKTIETSDVNVPDVQSAQDKHMFSDQSLVEKKEITVSLEHKPPSNEDLEHVKNPNVETQGSHQFHLTSVDAIGFENTISLQASNKEFTERNMARCSSIIGKPDDVLEKETSHIRSETDIKMTEDSSLLSMHTPQRRARSPSPGATPENLSKRPATVCAFYARGWCIKGNSCRFLHQEEDSKDLSKSSRDGGVLDDTGSLGEADKSKMSSPHERPDSSNTQRLGPRSQMQRALVRVYGEENRREEFHKTDIPRVGATILRDEYRGPLGVGPQLDYVDESRHFLPRRSLDEEQVQQEIPKREFRNESPLSRGYSLTAPAVPDDRNYLGDSSISSCLYPNNDDQFGHERRSEDFAFRNLRGSFDSTFSYKSLSLPRSSSPYFSRPEVNNVVHNLSRDLPDSVRQRLERLRSSWEPSVPFRPSFNLAPAILSSAGSQYDPLTDSIEPHDSRNTFLQASERTINVNVSGTSMEVDPPLYESKVSEYSSKKIPGEGISDESKPDHGLSKQTSLVVPVTPTDTAVDGGSSSAPKEVDHKIPNHLVQSSINGADHDGELRNQGDESKMSKESKAMRFFRAALVEFVKDLVRPYWHEGRLTKDAHKLVVKKAVEKVLSALQAHQIPNTAELASQYLSTSRPKILKLVEAYVEKYANPRPLHD